VIPKNGKKIKKQAYAFINFMLNLKNAAQNAEYIVYSDTKMKKAKKQLPEE